jgi:alpha-mannosidase
VPSLGFAFYDIRKDDAACKLSTGLSITKSDSAEEFKLENKYYTVTVNFNGDIAGVFDKENKKEILKAPARLAFLHEKPSRYPAWNMDWTDRQNPPIGYVDGSASFKIIENGPVRTALQIVRKSRDSIFTQTIRLCAGDAGRRIEVKNFVDWQSTGVCLKAEFPLTAASPVATYNLTMGTFERGNNDPNKYEVPSHEWFDLTDKSGEYGITILEDCKFGSDKPDDNTLRLTLLYTPAIVGHFPDQGTQDWGRHEFLYGLYSHKGDWREGLSEWQGRRLNQPLVAFTVPVHSGGLGKEFSMLKTNTPQVDIRALKKKEDSDYIIIRLQELFGKTADNVQISAGANIIEAFEVDGQERRIGNAKIADGKLTVDMTAFGPRSFAVKLAQSSVILGRPQCKPVELQYTDDVVSSDNKRRDGNISKGLTMPAELLGNTIVSEGIVFKMGGSKPGEKNAVSCKGQEISLPAGKFNRLYILASAVGDTKADFTIAGKKTTLDIQNWTGFIGQYDSRVWKRGDYSEKDIVVGLEAGYIKRGNLAWFATHRHTPKKNDTYRFSYIFKYSIDIPQGVDAVILPDSPKVKIFAVTAAYNENDAAKPAGLLYDSFENWPKIQLRGTNPPPPPPQKKKHKRKHHE